MTPSGFYPFFSHLNRLWMLLSIIFLIFTSCQPSSGKETHSNVISEEEKEWLTQFFRDIMLYENGIYTLWGAYKPMTIVQVDVYSEEQKKAFYDAMTEEEKKNGFVLEEYSLPETWRKWRQISHRFPMKRYMLFESGLSQEYDPESFFIVFVDVLKTAVVIQNNYEAFRKAMGGDFHPLELTLSMNQEDSIFWKKLESHSHLYGLLFGFGDMNSYLFHWKHFDHPQTCDEFCEKVKTITNQEPIGGQVKFTIDNFRLPSFISFNEIDPMIDLYKEERLKIRAMYKDKEFLDVTLQKLTN
jgi:hypothetical protein